VGVSFPRASRKRLEKPFVNHNRCKTSAVSL
jgi:hypothetical protein